MNNVMSRLDPFVMNLVYHEKSLGSPSTLRRDCVCCLATMRNLILNSDDSGNSLKKLSVL